MKLHNFLQDLVIYFIANISCVIYFVNFFIIGDQGGSCDDYFVLNDPTRNSEYLGQDYCDSHNCDSVISPDWQGAAWYRMAEPAGTTIPEEPVDLYHCNTWYPGWLNGHHPATAGETINGKVCFASYGNTCYYETQIQIKHCTSYYLYYLVDAPMCWLRYCSTSTTLIGNVKTNRTEIL